MCLILNPPRNLNRVKLLNRSSIGLKIGSQNLNQICEEKKKKNKKIIPHHNRIYDSTFCMREDEVNLVHACSFTMHLLDSFDLLSQFKLEVKNLKLINWYEELFK